MIITTTQHFSHSASQHISRRRKKMKNRLLIALLLITALVMVACTPAATLTAAPTEEIEPTEEVMEPTDAPEPTEAMEPTEDATEAAGGGDQVEVFSWWTGGGEAAGLEAMTVVFNEMYPDIEFINAAVAGGAGTNARAVLATRLQANDPPISRRAQAGQKIIGTFVPAHQFARREDSFAATAFPAVVPMTLRP